MEFEDPTDDYGYNKCNKADREEEGEGTLTLLQDVGDVGTKLVYTKLDERPRTKKGYVKFTGRKKPSKNSEAEAVWFGSPIGVAMH